ncbi:MAG: Rho termination factor N-terminal domain-containing protein, partial [bacterium]
MDIKELESKTVAQLRDMAKEMGLTGYSSMKKADLVTAISGAPKAPAEAPPEPVAEETAPEPEAAAEEAPLEAE